MSGPAADRAARVRSRALLPGLLGGVLALVMAAQPWWRATGEGVRVTFTGTETTAGLGSALGVVALAGWLLILVLRTRGRRLVGLLLALTGAGIAVVGVWGLRPSEAAVRTQVRQVSLADQFALEATGWSYGYAVTGLIVLAGGLLVAGTAAHWPRPADRFTRSTAVAAATTAEDDPAAVWRAQDAGMGPTTASQPDQRLAPDVHRPKLGDTMGGVEAGTPPPPSE